MLKGGFVYILTNKHHTTLYTGVTSNIVSRIIKHKEKQYPRSFTSRYNLFKLVYYRLFDSIVAAITEEKRIKGGSRKQKIKLIESINPNWRDMTEDFDDW